jgi:glycosyltransferase involved in cell wall biosynthesis
MRLYYSVRTRRALKQRLGSLPLGLPHYSYGIVCQRFLTLFAEMGIQAIELPMPEIYPSSRDMLPGSGDTTRLVHVMFKAFDEFRLLKGAYNVAHVAWEYGNLPSFDRMSQFHSNRTHPLNDYVYALGLVDEIWVGCSFTRDTLVRAGLSNVHIIPAPISLPRGGLLAARKGEGLSRDAFMRAPLQIIECTRSSITRGQAEDPPAAIGEGLFMRIADCRLRGGKVFLSVFNPHDPRKNPGPMLAGFQRYCQRHQPKDLLIIKILVDGKFNTLDDVLRVILPRRCRESLTSLDLIDCENIILVCGLMSDSEMGRMYGAADFYLCTSNAEGQNLPLLEAMGHGVVPISPVTTAMADYVTEDNSIILQTTETPVYDSIASAYGLSDTRWCEVSAKEVTLGIERAAFLDGDTLEAKRAVAIQTVAKHYSPGAVTPLVRQRLLEIGQAVGANLELITHQHLLAAVQ